MRQETPVAIHVHSFIQNGSEEESVEFTSDGFYYVRNGKTYLTYHEEHDLGKIKTVVKITEKEILVMRSGAIQMKQRFIPGASTITQYKLPFGQMKLQTETKDIHSDVGGPQGSVKMTYTMTVGENQEHVHNMTIRYKEEAKA
ncbi:DUF1934 family protein [Bacillus sp. ISL-51]|uniref:DUF1934 domain-containing protein n=1 Tax=Bacteria TaxID=2 RepID=UPI001BED3C4E|nr:MULTISPECIES: DUF1934 family protein [Bacteria]MBT2573062.1 DUF1934 family protein [Bacillus sp. ISL-51]MBT2633979.1 DUF1934 family protein [Bacillus sp. ISL-26]MBT2713536.1 DUF1934 family protein [Pseudomonas sp. ISL-88]